VSYVYDERFIDAILFGEKRCPECGRTLPRSRPYFSPDRTQPDGLTWNCRDCRDCRNARDRRRAEAALTETA